MAHIHYQGLVVFDPALPLSKADVADLERSVGASLPSGYLEFLEACNGGDLDYSVRVPAGPQGRWIRFGLHRLSHVGPGQHSLREEFKRVDQCFWFQSLPERVLPIGVGGGGDTLYLDLTEGGYGQLLAFLFTKPAWTGLSPAQGVFQVAGSFEDYLAGLRVDTEDAREVWASAQRAATPEGLQDICAWLNSGLPGWRTRFGTLGLALAEEVAQLRGELEEGRLSQEAIDLARHCGSQVAAEVLGEPVPEATADIGDWAGALLNWGSEALHRAAIGVQAAHLALAQTEGILDGEGQILATSMRQQDEALLQGRSPPADQAGKGLVHVVRGLSETTPLTPLRIRNGIAHELVAWTLGYADPVRERSGQDG